MRGRMLGMGCWRCTFDCLVFLEICRLYSSAYAGVLDASIRLVILSQIPENGSREQSLPKADRS